MLRYYPPHIVHYTDAELSELASAALHTCIGGYGICQSDHMICTVHSGECTPTKYCSESFVICKYYYKP